MIRIKNKNRRSYKRAVQKASSALTKPIRLSILGKTMSRDIDCLVNVYAVNGLASTYYSFSTSTGAATYNQDLSSLFISQFSEFQNLVRDYSLFQVKSMSALITRNSTLISNNNVAGNIPSIFIQFSPNGSTNTSGTATADNAFEFNLNTFTSRNLEIMMPPAIVGKYNNNDYFPFGSAVWVPTTFNGVSVLPNFYINLGYLAPPTFQSGTTTFAFSIAQIHLKMRAVFAAPTNQ
jgi:hypothetical protein